MQTSFRNHTVLAGAAFTLTMSFLIAGEARDAQAQGADILFGKYVAGQNQIWLAHPNGSGAQRLMSSLLQAASPVASRDGRYIVATGQAPLVERQSSNLYRLDRVTGKLNQVTHNIDTKDTHGSTTYYVPDTKAFSPDGRRMILSEFAFSPGLVGQFLYVVNTDGTGVPITVASKVASGVNDARGVDWSPVADQVVIGYTSVSTRYGFAEYLTPLYLVQPVADAAKKGLYRQLTFPHGSNTWQEVDDVLPAFSPNGKQVAFVRKTKNYTNNGFGPTTAAILIINTDGTGQRTLATFQPTEVPNAHLSWSPDGTKLLFDLGNEIHTAGGYVGLADPAGTMLWTIDVNGTGLTRLPFQQGAAPSWSR